MCGLAYRLQLRWGNVTLLKDLIGKYMSEYMLKKLIKERSQLITEFVDKKQTDFPQKLTSLFDDYFSGSYENSRVGINSKMVEHPYAIVALGGYGRGEQCIFSDIDLLFLFKKSVPRETEALVKEIVYPLWDAGFEVGHATRTIKECVKMAGEDLEILMSLLDGRFICGMSSFFMEMIEDLRKKVIRFNAKKIISLIIQDTRERHSKYGESTHLLEPNLKEGQGGLRDYHAMLWIARVKSGLRKPKDLEYSGYISEKEYTDLTESVRYIRTLRNLLHYQTNRKCDQLHMEYQTKLSDLLDIKGTEVSDSVEIFLGDLHGHMEGVKRQYYIFLSELGYENSNFLSRSILGKRTNVKGLVVTKKNSLDFSSIESILENPELLLLIFQESSRLVIPLSASAKRVIREFSYLIDDAFIKNKKQVERFETILAQDKNDKNVLFEMKDSGFLKKFIPEFEKITNLIQFNNYHTYSVDIHSLKTVEMVKKIGTSDTEDPLFYELYKGLKDRKILLWACFLHDIGKEQDIEKHSEKGAHIATKILSRMLYSKEFVDSAAFLIREHLLLIKVATRRDLNDEESIISCARTVKDIERLKMLYLLTVSDSMATGEKAWGDWNSILLKDLFFKVLKMLKKGDLATSEISESVRRKKESAKSTLLESEREDHIDAFLDILSPRYLAYMTVDDILSHYTLYRAMGEKDFVWDVKKDVSEHSRIVTVFTKNAPGIFSKIAGNFTLSNINILDAQIYTWKNNIAVDVFHVTPPQDLLFEEDAWKRIKKRFQKVLVGELDLAGQIDRNLKSVKKEKDIHTSKSYQVRVDNDSSSFFTIIEVVATDFPGLLFTITDALYHSGVDIHVAKIATKIDQVIDVFYVRSISGEKIDSKEDERRIKSVLNTIITNNYKSKGEFLHEKN